jgi:NAD(P)-dependent dehydrogenase (short-subunit alcohol dehydrogenase family)
VTVPTTVLTGATSRTGLVAAQLLAHRPGTLVVQGRVPPDVAESRLRDVLGHARAGAHVHYRSYLDERVVGRPNPMALDPEVKDALHATTARLLGREMR